MAIASGARAILAFEVETTRGTTPGSSGKVLRATQRAINLQKGLLESAEVRTTGQVADQRHGFQSVAGSIGAQLSYADMNDLLENALRSSWETAPALASPGNIGITAATPSAGSAQFSRASGNFTADGVTVGDAVIATGFTNAANNRLWIVTAVGTTTLTVYDAGSLAVTQSPGAGPSIRIADRLRLGNTLKTWTVERQFPDLTTPQYQVFRGVAVNSLGIQVQPEAMVTLSAELLGMSGGSLSASSAWGSAPTAASSNSPMSAFNGSLLLNGVRQTNVTQVNINIANNGSTQAVVGSFFTPDIFAGTANVQGDIAAFLEDGTTLYNAFVNETEGKLLLELSTADGSQKLWIYLPRFKINGGELDPPQNGPIIQSAPILSLIHI